MIGLRFRAGKPFPDRRHLRVTVPSVEGARRRTEPEVRFAVPDVLVVDAFISGAGVIGDLILFHAGIFQDPAGHFFHFGGADIAGVIVPVTAGQRRPLLHGQRIGGKMPDRQLQSLRQISFPVFDGLTRQTVDQITGKVGQTVFREHSESGDDLFRIAAASDGPAQSWVKTLHTETHAVDISAQNRRFLRDQTFRIAFDRNLRRAAVQIRYHGQQFFEQFRFQHGRSPAAEINGMERKTCQRLQSFPDPVQPGTHQL